LVTDLHLRKAPDRSCGRKVLTGAVRFAVRGSRKERLNACCPCCMTGHHNANEIYCAGLPQRDSHRLEDLTLASAPKRLYGLAWFTSVYQKTTRTGLHWGL